MVKMKKWMNGKKWKNGESGTISFLGGSKAAATPTTIWTTPTPSRPIRGWIRAFFRIKLMILTTLTFILNLLPPFSWILMFWKRRVFKKRMNAMKKWMNGKKWKNGGSRTICFFLEIFQRAARTKLAWTRPAWLREPQSFAASLLRVGVRSNAR